MLRLDASRLAGFLAVACAALWLLARVDDPRRAVSNAGLDARPSPMDMPLWYRIPWQQGEQYQVVRPLELEEFLEESRSIAIRGFW